LGSSRAAASLTTVTGKQKARAGTPGARKGRSDIERALEAGDRSLAPPIGGAITTLSKGGTSEFLFNATDASLTPQLLISAE